jgi:NADPH:quinone reductase-like Zn-dependent oxidoreductase
LTIHAVQVPRVIRSTIIDAPIEAVWAVLRDFNGHDRWHPIVAESHVEAERASDEIGAVRNFRLRNGAQLREQLLELDDRDHSFTYCILDSPIPLIGYVAKVTLKRVTDGNRTFWDWRSQFATPPGLEAQLERMVGEEVYDGGIEAVRALVERRRGTAPAAASRAAALRPGRAAIEGQGIVIVRHGGPETLAMARVSAASPGPGEVRLRHTAIGVNYIDVYVRTGAYPLLTPPGTPGMEAAGQVIDVGEGVVGILPGDRVAYACPPVGAYAQVRTMKADQLVVLPPHVSDEAAAAVMLKGMTAEYLLRRTVRVRRGDTILVHSAAGGVGLFLCQWAKHLGAIVIGTVSSDEKARIARANGCDYPIVHTADGFLAHVMEITGGRGTRVVYDAVGKDTFGKSLEALAPCGQLVSYGQASGGIDPIDPGALSAKSATLSRPVLFHYTANAEDLRTISGNVFDMLGRGVLKVAINQRYALADAAQAHRDLESRRTTGASILVP